MPRAKKASQPQKSIKKKAAPAPAKGGVASKLKAAAKAITGKLAGAKAPTPAPVKAAGPAAPASGKGAKGKAKAMVQATAAQIIAASGKGGKKGAGASAAASASLIAGLVGRAGRPAREESEAVCREVACEGLSTSGGYCRLHYIKNWKKIKRKDIILREKKLNQYIEELVAKYPDKYIEAIRQDLANDKDFAKVIADLDLDESVDDFEGDQESPEALIESVKRDFEDEGEGF